jgi:two-component system, OmpR family, sensor histidine kinase PhoQ
VASQSVSRRLLISVTLLLLVFFGVTVAVLHARFRVVAEASLHDLLDAQMVALIASAEQDASGYVVPHLAEAEVRLATPGSGLYAAVRGSGGEMYWRSPSAAGSLTTFPERLGPGSRNFRYFVGDDGQRLASVSRGLRWEDETGGSRELTFVVATDLQSYEQQLRTFQRGLLGSFGVLAVLLLVALALLLRWALAPLRHLATQIRSVERGEQLQLDAVWPSELAGVVSNLNTLLQAERTRIARYRDTLGNLAHSLKTPLAVLRTVVSGGGAVATSVNVEVDRMSAIVEHQLRRAATSGGTSVGRQAIAVLPIAQDLRVALLKVHRNKDFSLELEISPAVFFVGDKDDFTEALGNLMDNAAKWCRSRVKVHVVVVTDQSPAQPLLIDVEDDGPGVPESERERVQERGARADQQVPGHGLGLAMVREMAEMYGGTLWLGESTLGGARVELRLPGR